MDVITAGTVVAALALGVGYLVLGVVLVSRIGVRRLLFVVGGLAVLAVAIVSLLPVSSRVSVAPARFGTLYAEGLYPVETDGTGTPFVWTRGDPSFTFDRLIRRPVTLIIDLRSATVAGGPDSAVRVAANGVPLGTVHPEVRNVRPQPFTFTFVPPATDSPQLRITLQTTTFAPAKNDMRQLGTMVTGITLDAHAAWADVARWRWLLWGSLALLAPALAAVVLAPHVPSLPVGYAAIIFSGLGFVGALLFSAAVVRVGVIDRRAYVTWLLGDALLGYGCLTALMAAPLGAAGQPSLGAHLATWWARRTPRVSRIAIAAGAVLVLALAAIPVIHIATIIATTGANTLSQDYSLYFAPADHILNGGYLWRDLIHDTWGRQTLYTIPLVIDVALVSWTHWNIYTDLFLGFGVSVCRLILLERAFTAQCRRPARWLLWLILAALVFSTSQINLFTSVLYGTSGLSSHLILCGLVLGVWALVRFPDRWRGVALACVGGAVASFSGALGPLTWPIFLLGLVLLGNRRILHYVVLLGAAALASFPYVYFLFLKPTGSAGGGVVRESPFQPRFILQAVGYPFAQGYSLQAAQLAGVIGLALGAIGFALLWRLRRTPVWRAAVPGVLLMAFGLLHVIQLSAVRGGLGSWYPSGLMTYWIGLVGLAYALWAWPPPLSATALWARLTRRAGPIWSVVTVISLTSLYLTSNLTYEDKVDTLYLRSPAAAECVRNYRDAPPYCVPVVAPVSAPITATSLDRLAEPLERHRLSVFAPHEEWSLQGDYLFDAVRVAQSPDVPGVGWSPDLTLTSAPWWDYRHLNLLLYPPNSLTWTLTLPATLTRADFHSAVAISTAAEPDPAADGVTFTIALSRGNGEEQPLFSRHLTAGEHQWQPFTLPLSAYAGQTITLQFSTMGGAHTTQDFAMYRYPYIDLDGIAKPGSSAAPVAVQPTDSDLRLDPHDGKQWQTKHMDRVPNTPDTWVVGSDPTFLYSLPLNVCLADYTHLMIRLAASPDIYLRTMTILYGLDGDEPTKELTLPLYADGALHDYTYDLKLLGAGPRSQLTSLRVRPVLAGKPGAENQVQVTDVRLIRRAGPSMCGA